jgi:zinc/manganese transport system ATP-binding protein
MVRPQHGTVCIHGRALEGRPDPQVGYVPQLETVDWSFPVTVEQAVLMGRTRRSSIWPWPAARDRRLVRETLDQLEIGHLARQHIRNLSGGQQQRVFLARALVAEPDLLVLDEPTTGVDMRTAENVLHMLAHLNQQGITILMTTHDLNAAAAHVPWVICLNRRIIAQGTPEQIFTTETLNETYQGDMLVLRHDGMLFVQQKPHHHGYRDLVPNPVPGHDEARGAGREA